ncbi:MAG: cyclic nucleotide-binding domain-containing protein [Dehalococcoidales bacterium]|jgi:CRP-like cAMP-binding protein|nr:cyclic nucleotide-binding domain-containing protein [Dehalococcoidales bacterium]
MNKLEVLRRSDVFHYLDDEDLKTVAEMCTTEVFEAGKTIFRQDQENEKLYVIEDGLVSVLLELGPTDKRQIQAASNYECFGWSASIPPYRCVCTVKTMEKTKVLAFNGKDLRNLVYTNPKLCAEIAGGVAYVISQRLRAAFSQLMGVAYQD